VKDFKKRLISMRKTIYKLVKLYVEKTCGIVLERSRDIPYYIT